MCQDEQLTLEQIEILLGAATAAPSMHNTQPWRFEVNGHVIDVFLDGARVLPAEDASGRAMRIAAGAAVLNVRVAAAHLGYDSWFGLAPCPEEPDLMARIVLEPSEAVDPALRALYREVSRRHTDRRPAPPVGIPDGIRVAVLRAACAENAELTWLPQAAVTETLELVREAEVRGLVDWNRAAERRRWVGGSRTEDGIPAAALGPRSTAYPAVVRDLGVSPLDRLRPVARFEKQPALAVLSSAGDTDVDQLVAGMALQRVLLTATRHGLSASFLNQPLEYDDLRVRVQKVTGNPGHAHMLIRFLPRVMGEHAPRRPVASYLRPARTSEAVTS
ncbi:MAG TPA: hypothetical protein VFB74_29380 [Kribbellaceae bacterium]|nr:hypothetical protein [Kribbellaceae bacterium]